MTQNLKLASAIAVVASAAAIPAAAELKYENNSGGHVLLYGQLHPALISVDDGQQTETRVLDNDLSNSRVGLWVVQPYGDNTFKFRFETGLGLPSSTEWNQVGTNFGGWTRQDLRHIDFSYEGTRWGKVSAGQGSMASDGAAEVNLSYVGNTLYSFTNDENNAFFYRDTAGNITGNPTIGASSSNFDGGRRTRIRYDTPDFNGFSAGVAWGKNELSTTDDDEYYDVALNYGTQFANGVEFKAALAYGVRDRANNAGKRKDTIGSASVLLQSGLSFTVAAGSRSDDATGAVDPSYVYGQIAYDMDVVSWGKTGIGVDYYDGKDFNSNGSKTKVWGIAIAQKIDSINTDAYLKYRSHDFDETTANYQKNGTWVLGARWKF